LDTTAKTIELVHIWTNEAYTVPIEVFHKDYVSIRWGQAGTYDLILKTNVLRARSVAARRKNPIVPWQAKNIDWVRRLVWEHFNPNHVEQAKSVVRHQENAPYKLKTGSIYGKLRAKPLSSSKQ